MSPKDATAMAIILIGLMLMASGCIVLCKQWAGRAQRQMDYVKEHGMATTNEGVSGE